MDKERPLSDRSLLFAVFVFVFVGFSLWLMFQAPDWIAPFAYPQDVRMIVAGTLIGLLPLAANHVFGTAVASRTAKQQGTAADQGKEAALSTPASTTTVTVPPVTGAPEAPEEDLP